MIAEILFTLGLVLFFVLHEKYRMRDDQTADVSISRELSRKWHKHKGGVQLVVFTYLAYVCFDRHSSWLYAIGVSLTCMSLYWNLHDGFLNRWQFREDWFHVGTSAETDQLGKGVVTALKIASMAIGITMLIVWKTFS